jgi:hypothetical protein
MFLFIHGANLLYHNELAQKFSILTSDFSKIETFDRQPVTIAYLTVSYNIGSYEKNVVFLENLEI